MWLTNTWKDAQHHSLSKKCKSKPQWGIISHQSEWLLSKSLQVINVGEGVEKREPSYTVGGNANYGEQCGDSFKNWKFTQRKHISLHNNWKMLDLSYFLTPSTMLLEKKKELKNYSEGLAILFFLTWMVIWCSLCDKSLGTWFYIL